MGFIKQILRSIYSPAFYNSVGSGNYGRPFQYFFLLISVITILRVIPIVVSFAITTQPEIAKFVKSVTNYYPKDLVISIKNGVVTTNANEPYIVPLPHEGITKYEAVVIDTKTPFSIQKMKEYNATVWLTKEALYVKSKNDELRIYDLTDVKDFKLNREMIDLLVSKIIPWLVVLTPLVAIFIIFALFMSYLFRLLYLFFLALLIMLLSQILKNKFSYKTSYRIGLYAITLPLFVEILQNIESSIRIPFLFTIVALIVVFVNFQKYKISQQPTTPAPQNPSA